MSTLTKKGVIIKGYKIVDENLCCQPDKNKPPFQYKVGEWVEHEGDLNLCASGFHFCEYPSGPWCYYNKGRMFKVEAEEVLLSSKPGATRKHVAKRIRLVEEVFLSGDGNTGYRNTGYENTGDRNTGNRNTGYENTGDRNTGNGNTGYENTGDRNTGNRNAGYGNAGNGNTGDGNTGYGNTGYGNSGDRNTGNRNTGDRNTGDRNTGDRNTGNRNTGDGNCGNFHSGCLNIGDAPFYIFNKKADREKVDFSLVHTLCSLLEGEKKIDPTPFLSLPNATPKAIKSLHKAHREARKNLKEPEQKP